MLQRRLGRPAQSPSIAATDNDGTSLSVVHTFALASPSPFGRLPRTDAAEVALREKVAELAGPAGPADIERYFRAHGRDDKRDHISAAMAYLKSKHRAYTVGHAKWLPGSDPLNAESPAVTRDSETPNPGGLGG
jgi:hypothetical protein